MLPKFLRFTILIMTILAIGSSFSYASASEAKTKKQVILVLINNLSLTDKSLYSDLIGFKTLEENGSMGLMNINSSGGRTDTNSYLTIGVGSKANGFKELSNAYMANEFIGNSNLTAYEIYQQQTGKINIEGDSIILLTRQRLYSLPQKFPLSIGALGEQLRLNNLEARVYGNNDTTEKRRLAPLITMDAMGVSKGNIGEKSLQTDNTRPFGVKTDYDYLLEKIISQENQNTSLLVYDLGDLYRLEEFRHQMSEEYQLEVKTIVLSEIGSFLEEIIKGLKINQLLIVASPMVNNDAAKNGYLLAPIWIYDNVQTAKLLTSETTRREGLVANIDLVPTILARLGVAKSNVHFIGKEIMEIPSNLNIQEEMTHIATIYRLRQTVLYTYVMWQIIVLIIAMVYWFKKDFLGKKIVKAALLSILYLPFIILISAFITPSNAFFYLSFILFLGMLLGYVTETFSPKYIFIFIGFTTFLLISIDVFNKSELMKRSFLGYDPIIGARYYGIGNEYMGIYIGGGLLFTTALLQVKRNLFTIIFSLLTYLFIIGVLLMPILGTNAGGAISATFAMSFTFLKLIHLKWNKKNAFLFMIIVLLGLSFLIGINYFTPSDQQSHIGRALNELNDGNLDAIVQTIKRKISMNWRLIQVSSWSKVLITSIIAIGIMLLKNNFKSLRNQYPELFNGFYGIVLGAFVSLLINDSGIVAAATLIIFVTVPILYLAIKNQQELKG